MLAGLDGFEGRGPICRRLGDIDVMALQILHQVGRMFLADDRNIERLIGLTKRLLKRKIDHEGEQNGAEQRAHEQRRKQSPPVAQVVANLL